MDARSSNLQENNTLGEDDREHRSNPGNEQMRLQIYSSWRIICTAGSTAVRSTHESDVQAVGLRAVWSFSRQPSVEERLQGWEILRNSQQRLFEHKNLATTGEAHHMLVFVTVNQRVLVGVGATIVFSIQFFWLLGRPTSVQLIPAEFLLCCTCLHGRSPTPHPTPPLCCQPEGAALGRARPSGSLLFIFIYMIFFF